MEKGKKENIEDADLMNMVNMLWTKYQKCCDEKVECNQHKEVEKVKEIVIKVLTKKIQKKKSKK
jgi:hypothetical protein